MVVRQRAIHSEDKEERRHAILDAAARLLLGRPDAVPSVAEVAGEAGLAKGTVYLYFAGKEELFLALHERRTALFFEELAAMLRRLSAPSFDAVLAIARRRIVEDPLFLPLASRCFAMMQSEISASAGDAFRRRMGERLIATGALLERRFRLDDGDGVVLLRQSYALIIGLWQMAAAHGSHRHAPDGRASRDAAMDVFRWEYPAEVERALRRLWSGRIGERRGR